MNALLIVRYVALRLIEIFELILLADVIASWVIRDPFNKVRRILDSIVEPVLAPIRALLFKFAFFRNCPIDFSTLIAFLLCGVIVEILL